MQVLTNGLEIEVDLELLQSIAAYVHLRWICQV